MTTEPRWLDDEEQRTWRSFLMASRLLFDRLEQDLKQDTDLSFAYYEILTRLSEAPGRSMRMADLAAACVFDRSRLSHAIDRLARDGWVRRVPSPSAPAASWRNLPTRAWRKSGKPHAITSNRFGHSCSTVSPENSKPPCGN
ncbi:MarR family winged helix-turn-helix transcriptional regulator [Streptomyces chiangmaiensis]